MALVKKLEVKRLSAVFDIEPFAPCILRKSHTVSIVGFPFERNADSVSEDMAQNDPIILRNFDASMYGQNNYKVITEKFI